MSKSLGRLDVVRDVKTELGTQSSALTFKPGRPIDFRALANAVDRAGFTAGSITIWARGTPHVLPDGRLDFIVSGTKQAFPLADSPKLVGLKRAAGKEVSIVATVQFRETPPWLIVEEEEPIEGRMRGMGEVKGAK